MKGNFQIVVLIIFLVGAVFSVFVFSGTIKLGKDKKQTGPQGTVVLWGTIRNEFISKALEDLNESNQAFTISYVQKSAENFDNELLEALASGTGPDLFFLTNDLAYHYKNKIFGIPYDVLPLVSFKTSFSSAAEVFVNSKGIMAVPIAIDPIVMYYNRSILDSAGIVYPPTTWDQFSELIPLLTKKDDNKKISKSTVGLGQFSNISNAKEILTAMFLQTGNNLVVEKDGAFISTLGNLNQEYSIEDVLGFYTDFADPLKQVYSWNKSLPESRDFFSSENLAFYFGYASEKQSLLNKNPNQNFFVAPIPQIKGTNSKSTYAKVSGVAVSNHTKSFETALAAATSMAMSDFAEKYALAVGAAPARRDLLNKKQQDIFSVIFYNSALFAKSWLDPSPTDTDNIFQRMVDSILSNNLSIESAIKEAENKMSLLLLK